MSGLSDEDLAAIRRALALEENPRHLAGHASTLMPAFPVWASLLAAKSSLLELRAPANRQELEAGAETAFQRLEEILSTCGIRPSRELLVGAPFTPASDLVQVTRELGDEWSDVEDVWEAIAHSASFYRVERLRAARDGALRILSAARCDLRSRVSCSIEDIDHPEIAAARALVEIRPDEPGNGLGYLLQTIGWPDLYGSTTPGRSFKDRLLEFGAYAQEASDRGVPIQDVILARRVSVLEALARGDGRRLAVLEDETRRATCELVARPESDLSKTHPACAALARCLTREIAPGVVILDPARTRLAFRTGGIYDAEKAARTADRDRWNDWHRRSEECNERPVYGQA